MLDETAEVVITTKSQRIKLKPTCWIT